MRFGVSTKIFLAYAVLLSVFAVSSVFTLVYLRRGRQELSANQRRLEVQVAADAALRSLEDFVKTREGSGQPTGLTSRVAAQNGIASARQDLKDALDAIDRYLKEESRPARRVEFDAYRVEIGPGWPGGAGGGRPWIQRAGGGGHHRGKPQPGEPP